MYIYTLCTHGKKSDTRRRDNVQKLTGRYIRYIKQFVCDIMSDDGISDAIMVCHGRNVVCELPMCELCNACDASLFASVRMKMNKFHTTLSTYSILVGGSRCDEECANETKHGISNILDTIFAFISIAPIQ